LKAIPGLQLSGASFEAFRDEVLTRNGWFRSACDPAVFQRHNPALGEHRSSNEDAILCCTVDDLEFTGFHLERLLQPLKDQLCLRVSRPEKVGDMQSIVYCNTRVLWTENKLVIDQGDYVASLLKRFTPGAVAATPIEAPILSYTGESPAHEHARQSVAGCLNYLVTVSRPDLAVAVRELASSKGCTESSELCQRALRYLRQPRVLQYTKTDDRHLLVSCDASFAPPSAREADHRRSISGWTTILFGCPVGWVSRKQPTVALSPGEAELICMAEGHKTQLYFDELSKIALGPSVSDRVMETDSATARRAILSDQPTSLTRYLQVKAARLKEAHHSYARIEHKSGKLIVADGLTKALAANLFNQFCTRIGTVSPQ
jgi:hypothetical protein